MEIVRIRAATLAAYSLDMHPNRCTDPGGIIAMSDIIRRTVGLVVACVLSVVAYDHGWFGGLVDSFGQFMVLVAAAVVVIVFCYTYWSEASKIKQTIAVIIAVCATAYVYSRGLSDLEDVFLSWKLLVTAVVAFCLWAITCLDSLSVRVPLVRSTPARSRA